jgi:hypothetical protein
MTGNSVNNPILEYYTKNNPPGLYSNHIITNHHVSFTMLIYPLFYSSEPLKGFRNY